MRPDVVPDARVQGERPLRVGRISYLNVEPFFHAFPWPLAATLAPRQLGEAVAEGRLDAGPLALPDGIRLGPRLRLLPYGIATRGPARSVLLFSRRPLGELGGARIAVTGETATSVRLLRMLLAFREEVPPAVLVDLDEPADATLLIGDAALRARRGAWPHDLCFDLGEEWSRWTGLPCVFAVWAVRDDAPARGAAALEAVLGTALDTGLRELPAIARRRRETGLSPAEVEAYLRSFRYRLGPEEDKGVAEFRRLLGLLDA